MRRTNRSSTLIVWTVGTVLAAALGLLPAVAADLGSLTVITEPNTAVRWEGHTIGTTDSSGRMTISNIPLGEYLIALQKNGFEAVEQSVGIGPGIQSLQVSMSNRPAPEPAVFTPAADTEPAAANPSLPDPFARQSTPLTSIGFMVFLVAVAAGALWLGRRRRQEPDELIGIQEDGPRVVLADEPRGRPAAPGFYEDLRQRETVLEGLEEGGPHRPRPKVIELPVTDHRPVEGDS